MARTILELGDELDEWQLANVIHEAEFRGLFDERELLHLLDRHRGRGAVTTVRRALAIRAGGSWGTLSEGEDRFRSFALGRGLRPGVNVAVRVADGTVRPDFSWGEELVAVEFNGSGHDRARTQREDKGKLARLREVGWVVVPCTEDTIDDCLDRVELLLGERSGMLVPE